MEVDTDGRIRNVDTYDLEDFDAALTELDARYIAGEASPYANSWSVVAGAYAAIGRNEFPAMTADAVSIDHRRAASFAPGNSANTSAPVSNWTSGSVPTSKLCTG